MKHFCTSLLVLVSSIVHAQWTGASGNYYCAAESGITNFHAWDLNANGNGNSYRFTQLYTFGLSTNAPVGGRNGDFADGSLAFHFFLPNDIEWYTDTSSLKESGWELMTSLFGFDLIPNRRVDFVVGPGVYWGRLKLRNISRYNGPPFDYSYKNPFIAPMIRADLRLAFEHIVFGCRASCRYDLTGADWKRETPVAPALPGYRFREMQYMVYLGWKLRTGN